MTVFNVHILYALGDSRWEQCRSALHRAKCISSNFDSDIKTLETTFLNAGCQSIFISHTVITFKLPYCKRFLKLSKTLISKLKNFTGFKHIFIVLWQTRQIKSLFNPKGKKIHRSHAVYKGDCSAVNIDFIGDTRRNVEVRIDEHSNPSNDSEPALHLRENRTHCFSWRILCTVQSFHKRRIIEGLIIQQWRPSLNKQVHPYVAKLFPSGIT